MFMESVKGNRMKGIPAATVPIPIIAWEVILPEINLINIAPTTKPIDLHEKKKVNSVSGMWCLLERKGITGPGATMMQP